MPLNLKNLPHEGYSERENSDAINQIIQFAGGPASVFSGAQFTVPINHFVDVGPFRVNDVNVVSNSLIFLSPIDATSTFADVFVSLVGSGFFELNDDIVVVTDALNFRYINVK